MAQPRIGVANRGQQDRPLPDCLIGWGKKSASLDFSKQIRFSSDHGGSPADF
jgi:hypothetical protein